MSKRLRGLRIVPGLALVALLATACAPGVTHSTGGMDSGVRQSSAGSVDGSNAGPKPIILKNTAPSQLDVYLTLTLGGYDVTSRDQTAIYFSFTSAGRPVQFVGAERVVCDGKALTRYPGEFSGTMLTASVAGKTLTCVYTSGATSTSVTLAIPHAPVIVSPHDGARIPRATATTITYQIPPGSLAGVVATGHGGKALPAPGAMTATRATIDTSALANGAGAISLREDLTLPTPTATFRSLHVSGYAITMVNVTWL